MSEHEAAQAVSGTCIHEAGHRLVDAGEYGIPQGTDFEYCPECGALRHTLHGNKDWYKPARLGKLEREKAQLLAALERVVEDCHQDDDCGYCPGWWAHHVHDCPMPQAVAAIRAAKGQG